MKSEVGTYALVLSSLGIKNIRIGRLGWLETDSGFYVYVGSAFGPGGLRARVSRHRRQARCRHWHIDYLRSATRLEEIWCSYDRKCREHQWARLFRQVPGASTPMRGFGASDCRCESHLFFFATRPSLAVFSSMVRSSFADHGPLEAICTNLEIDG
jgi:Uri superfamily endonuclease